MSAFLEALPEIQSFREQSAKRLLEGLLRSEGHGAGASAFTVKDKPKDEGEELAHWLEADARSAGEGATSRRRPYLAFY